MSDVSPTAGARREGLHEQTVARLNNLDAQVAAGFEAHPYTYARTHHARDVLAAHPANAEGVREPGQEWPETEYSLAGRVTLMRHMGKAAFADLQDEHGSLQLHFSRQDTENFDPTKKIDLGDIIGVRGFPFVTKTGQLTLRVTSWQPLVKSLHPMPSKFHGLQDEELRARRRYLDLMINPERREAFRTRSRAIRYIRNFLDSREFMEVEGPTLQVVAGGTEAKPFTTHHNALSHDFSLRISLELYLKRLLVGGFERVYEIGRNYRNEGIDRTHNPEFTMLEAYFAYGDYNDMMQLVEEMLHGLVTEVKGEPKLSYQGQTVDFSLPFRRLDFVTALKEAAGLDFEPTDLARLRTWTDEKHPEMRKVPDYKLLDKLFGEYVEPTLINPTFVTDVPLAISPLVKAHRSREALAERADLFVAGFELAPIYSELNDALDQRARFEAQTQRRDAGDDEAHEQDEDFLLALEYGMPPAAGMGMGMDRLAMLLTDSDSIRDVLLFPLLRPEGTAAEPDDQVE
ncbi:lysine--tRNA ligase [Deinococcus deserti]|uniref:Lysine--tRNA ligase n=1 Tax=Deinococcus deserti (strain DSM 17065 / CIP 109153 / LMG 22923 / VCD115) TaxID=546414 RepID=C1D0G5_DEIDV|nr:lysine--tRNA ligase [Deinococcus deserti]ACO45339.1 putative lysine--tRNA ligase (lysyl-tRNA synthetase) [Deinococcus deserti VCD115]